VSDYLLAEGFGPFKDGVHTQGSDIEVIGQWASYAQDFSLTDKGDGRKWLTSAGSTVAIGLASTAWTTTATISVCFRLFAGTRHRTELFQLRDGASFIGFISIDTSGQIYYNIGEFGIRGMTAGVLATSTPVALGVSTHVEVRITLHNSTGTVKIYLDGVLTADESGLDTISNGASCTSILFNGFSASYGFRVGWKITDIIFHKSSTPVGDLQVPFVIDDTAGTDDDFTPSAGSNEDNVDEIGPDEDATYNSSETPGERDSFTGDGVALGDIKTVLHYVRARKEAAGAATLLIGALHGGSEDQSAAKAVTETYSNLTEFFDTCPSTAAAWSAAEVAAAENTMEVG